MNRAFRKSIHSTTIEVHLPQFDDVVEVTLEFSKDCFDIEAATCDYIAKLNGEEIELTGTNDDKAIEAISEWLFEEEMYLEQERAEYLREQRYWENK